MLRTTFKPNSVTLDKSRINRILVIKWSAMGDLAMAGAAFEDIARSYPDCRIDLDTLPPWDSLYANDPRFSHVHCFNLRKGSVKESWRWLKAIAAVDYDLVIDLQTTDRSRILLALLSLFFKPIAYRAGNKQSWPYNLALPQGQVSTTPRHALQIARDTLAAAGIIGSTTYPHLHVPASVHDSANALLRQHGLEGQRFAVLLPGCQAAGYLKRWGQRNYVELAQLLLERGIQKILVLGGPDEMEECAGIAKDLGDDAVNLCGATALLELPVICGKACVTVANDTGTAHLASAANVPMLVTCGPTDPRRVLPAGPKVRAAQLSLPCINCYRKHCGHHSCMRLLTPAHVMRIAQSLVPALSAPTSAYPSQSDASQADLRHS